MSQETGPKSPWTCGSSKRAKIEEFISKMLDYWESLPEEERGLAYVLFAYTGHTTTRLTDKGKGKNLLVYSLGRQRIWDESVFPAEPHCEFANFNMTRPPDA
jgi:hypothetical protein